MIAAKSETWNESTMIYLASPYSHEEPRVVEDRVEAVRRCVLSLLRRGDIVFSPIAYSHQFAASMGGDWDSWSKFDRALIDAARELWVLMLPGWSVSVGVKAEVDYAVQTGKPVRYLTEELEMSFPC